jgi:hypothetical protein
VPPSLAARVNELESEGAKTKKRLDVLLCFDFPGIFI